MKWASRTKRKPRRSQPEGLIVNACLRWLLAHGIKARRNNTGAIKMENGRWIRFGEKGSGDIEGWLPNGARAYAVECKTPVGKLTDDQKAYRDRLEADGGLYILARSIDDLETHKSEILNGG